MNTKTTKFRQTIDEMIADEPNWVAHHRDQINTMYKALGGDEQLMVGGNITYLLTANVRVINNVDMVTENLINDGFDNVQADHSGDLVSNARTVTMNCTVSAMEIDETDPFGYFVENYEGNEYNRGGDSRVEIKEIVKVVEVSRSVKFVWRLTSL